MSGRSERAGLQLKAFADARALHFQADTRDNGETDISVYSSDMKYRYAFARWWASDGPFVLWVGANPGTGDTEQRHRPTLDRCITRSRAWSTSGVLVGNLFAARSKAIKEIRSMSDPVGPHNDEALLLLTRLADRTIVAWGNWGRMGERAVRVGRLLSEPKCLGLTAAGQPRHPLYVPLSESLVPWLRKPE